MVPVVLVHSDCGPRCTSSLWSWSSLY